MDGRWLLVAGLVLQRLLELTHARRNTRRLLQRPGAREAGSSHYRWIVLLHTGFIVSLALEILLETAIPPPTWPAAAGAFAAVEALRGWSIAALGPRWTTRIIVVPGEPPVSHGPYRLLPHPNYLAVSLGVVLAPLIIGAWRTALVFAPLNAWLLHRIRIPAEEAAQDTAALPSRYER